MGTGGDDELSVLDFLLYDEGLLVVEENWWKGGLYWA